eukprot:TRINITY_DN9465_c0_g1_i1.p1 TRINITY_DN9465_c0_g1~~TRINITY_DN9465_c0_g1_i1.p1  ORF type:complete len:111 (-),score=38.24 TRINITY_DN9465_c0_g1_i1:165-497(-)
MSSSDDEKPDMEFDYWPTPQLEELCSGLHACWDGAMVALTPNQWRDLAVRAGLPEESGEELQSAVLEEFERDISSLEGNVMIGDGSASESRLVAMFHKIKHILYLSLIHI